MIEIRINYEGELHCSALHVPSGNTLVTDAPVDNNGRGEAFSPTDLVATALGSCMATVMGIVAQRKQCDLAGLRIVVQKEMSQDTPRRIVSLPVAITMPIRENHPVAALLQAAVLSCPVHHSIHPDISVDVTWDWRKENS
jgi:putative redox protein